MRDTQCPPGRREEPPPRLVGPFLNPLRRRLGRRLGSRKASQITGNKTSPSPPPPPPPPRGLGGHPWGRGSGRCLQGSQASWRNSCQSFQSPEIDPVKRPSFLASSLGDGGAGEGGAPTCWGCVLPESSAYTVDPGASILTRSFRSEPEGQPRTQRPPGRRGFRAQAPRSRKLTPQGGTSRGSGASHTGARQRPLCVHACCSFSRVQLFVTPWTVARQAPLSTGFSRQESWRGLPCPLPKGPHYRLFCIHHEDLQGHWEGPSPSSPSLALPGDPRGCASLSVMALGRTLFIP